jgi:exodeoxyribonuclease V alpha subunit
MDEGHCGLPVEEVVGLGAKLLEVSPELIEAALALELETGDVVAGTVAGRECVFLGGLYHAEQAIAERLKALASGSVPWPAIEVEKAIPWVEARTGLALAESQREAVRLALGSKVLVITGGPGVGKTTLVNSVLKVLRPSASASRCAPPPGAPPSGCRRARAWRPGPFTACWRSILPAGAIAGLRRCRSTAICWWWTRPAWWT